MAIFMDLDDDEPVDSSQHNAYDHHRHAGQPEWTLWPHPHPRDALITPVVSKPKPEQTPPRNDSTSDSETNTACPSPNSLAVSSSYLTGSIVNRKSKVMEALGCYPVVMAVASALDLNAIDNLSRTCRTIHDSLLQYRSSILTHTLHCVNEDLEVDREDTLRYRARAGNWYYMQEDVQGSYNGKSGNCARDMVAECRRCSQAICRNCAIKPPAPVVLKERHRRLCIPCTKAPLPLLVNPPLDPHTPLASDAMRVAVCNCSTDSVWLCQPCGRSIRGSDSDYRGIWRWRNQYGEVLGGVGTGIGEGDRGVPCGRESKCCNSKQREQDTDCDAEDGRAGSVSSASGGLGHHHNGSSYFSSSPSSWSSNNAHGHNHHAASSPWSIPSASSTSLSIATTPPHSDTSRTPSPQLRPGYARHEVEGIGGVVKSVGVRLVRVGACVPEWEDERHRGIILGREVSGRSRSWCGWCWRVIPGKKDIEIKDGQVMNLALRPT